MEHVSFWKYCIAILGAFQFGYAIAIMAGALLFLAPLYELDAIRQGFLVSAILIWALVGSAVAGVMADNLGRKKSQILIACLFLIGALVVTCSLTFEVIVIGRILQGLAVGTVSVVGPMYIAEVAPASQRGRYVSFYQLAVTFGILCAYSISYLFAREGAWRWMFVLGTLPALAHGIGFLSLPDSRPKDTTEKVSWKTILDRKNRPLLIAAILVNFFQQFTGINAVIYFAPSIFEVSGFKSASTAILSAVLIGAINFLSTFVAIFLVDRKGRKPLLLVGLAGMIISLLALCLSSNPWVAVGSLMIYVGCFAFGLGPIPQLITSEIFPDRVRSRGVSIAMFVSWICNFLVVFTFMDLVTYLTQAGAFLLYALFGLVAFYFIWKKLPETNGIVLKK